MARDMGLGVIGDRNTCFRQQNRWMFRIADQSGGEIIGDTSNNAGRPMLPPSKAARPNLELKEMEVRHVTETVFYPGRPEWKPLNITLYHIGPFQHDPVWDWILSMYDPQPAVADNAVWKTPVVYGNPTTTIQPGAPRQLMQNRAILELYNGCGDVLERWVYQTVWPQTVDWGMLDMSSSDVVYIDLTLRYARAYVER